MAPKKSSGSGTKIRKTSEGSSRSASQASRKYDAHRFLGPDQQDRFKDLGKRTIWYEKKFCLNPQGEHRAVHDILERRKWDKLFDPPMNINVDIVREFYANALPIEEEPYQYTTYVRGKQIRFERDALNDYLGEPITVPPDHLCAYSETLANKNWPIANMKRHIFIEGESFVKSKGQDKRAAKDTMTIPAQIIHLLILYNLKPLSHVNSASMDCATLLWYILAGLQVDIARVIANEMKAVAESGIVNLKKPVLPYPALIMGLFSAARVTFPDRAHVYLSGPINDDYIARYCKKKAPPQPPAPQPPTEPQHEFPAIDPNLQNWFYHTWDQNSSNHRALTVLQESMYRMQLYQGVPENPDYQVMTPQQFQTHIVWPGDRPHFTGGADTSNVGGNNASDEPIGEAATNAMDDEEDATQTMEGDDLVDFDE